MCIQIILGQFSSCARKQVDFGMGQITHSNLFKNLHVFGAGHHLYWCQRYSQSCYPRINAQIHGETGSWTNLSPFENRGYSQKSQTWSPKTILEMTHIKVCRSAKHVKVLPANLQKPSFSPISRSTQNQQTKPTRGKEHAQQHWCTCLWFVPFWSGQTTAQLTFNSHWVEVCHASTISHVAVQFNPVDLYTGIHRTHRQIFYWFRIGNGPP